MQPVAPLCLLSLPVAGGSDAVGARLSNKASP